MKKTFALLLTAVLVMTLFSGCVGTTVVIGECTCPDVQPDAPYVPAEGAVKTGLAVMTNIKDSTAGLAKYDVTLVAVAVDDNGVIVDCVIDGIAADVKFDTTGTIITDLTLPVQTKNELGEKYGMVAWGNAKAEWNAQAQAFADYVTGKTVAQVKGIAVTETTKPADGTDLAASVTIAVGGFMKGVELAVANAAHRGAQAEDTLVLATIPSVSKSTSAAQDKAGTAQLDADVTVLTKSGDKITSCYMDSIQAKVAFDATGAITTDLSVPVQTKNELGEKYGMVAWGNAKAEWNAQAQAFADYVTGKTAAQVKDISVTETTKPADGTDLAASVTIAIGGFQALIAKAMQK